jgi:hypothetical protein
MANMELITSVTVGSGGAASVTLPATGTIPQTYTDLKVVATARSTRSGSVDDLVIRFNGSSSNYTGRRLYGSGSSAVSDTLTDIRGFATGAGTTASTFSNTEFYIPNYTSSNTFKSVSVDAVNENNATESYSGLVAGLWSNNSAITTITLLANNGNLVEGSTFYLYGISNVTSTTKATGGVVSTDGTYYYHMFPFTGTFTPTQSITADVLVIAGGGGGGGYWGGGGGAGGLLYFSSQSLTATGYTCTVGAGGTGGNAASGSVGGDSQFGALTLVKGGGLGSYGGGAGGTGGSGGGGSYGGGGGSATSGQGNAGGSATGGSAYTAGGGGGAGAAGGAAASLTSGSGGIGVNTYASFATATGTGANNGYYAGGGGGGGRTVNTNISGSGGLGGGGAGAARGGSTFLSNGTAGTANTGGGGGGGMSDGSTGLVGGNGGSGLVIIRYTA